MVTVIPPYSSDLSKNKCINQPTNQQQHWTGWTIPLWLSLLTMMMVGTHNHHKCDNWQRQPWTSVVFCANVKSVGHVSCRGFHIHCLLSLSLTGLPIKSIDDVCVNGDGNHSEPQQRRWRPFPSSTTPMTTTSNNIDSGDDKEDHAPNQLKARLTLCHPLPTVTDSAPRSVPSPSVPVMDKNGGAQRTEEQWETNSVLSFCKRGDWSSQQSSGKYATHSSI